MQHCLSFHTTRWTFLETWFQRVSLLWWRRFQATVSNFNSDSHDRENFWLLFQISNHRKTRTPFIQGSLQKTAALRRGWIARQSSRKQSNRWAPCCLPCGWGPSRGPSTYIPPFPTGSTAFILLGSKTQYCVSRKSSFFKSWLTQNKLSMFISLQSRQRPRDGFAGQRLYRHLSPQSGRRAMGLEQLPPFGSWQAAPLDPVYDPGAEQGLVRIPKQSVCRQPRNDEGRVDFRRAPTAREPSSSDGVDRRRRMVCSRIPKTGFFNTWIVSINYDVLAQNTGCPFD